MYKSFAAQAEELKDFIRLILRIKCLINALTAWDVGKAIDMCIQKTYCDDAPGYCGETLPVSQYDSKYDALELPTHHPGSGPIPENESQLCGIIPSPSFLKPPEPPSFCRGQSWRPRGNGSCAGPDQLWNIGGAQGQGIDACHAAVMADEQCQGDYFTYNTRSDGNCGCKRAGAGVELQLLDCPNADYFEIVVFPHWQKYLPETDLYKKYYYRGCFNLNITCRQKCCNQLTYLEDGLQPLVYDLAPGFIQLQ